MLSFNCYVIAAHSSETALHRPIHKCIPFSWLLRSRRDHGSSIRIKLFANSWLTLTILSLYLRAQVDQRRGRFLISCRMLEKQQMQERRSANRISQSWHKRFIHKAFLFLLVFLFPVQLKQHALLHSSCR